MVYVLLDGRIGNNLFQIATAASLAYDNSTDFRIIPGNYYTPDSCWLSDYLKQFETNILRKVKIIDQAPSNVKVYNETGFHYEKIPYQENILLNGFFQTEKYFNKQLVRDLFQIDDSTKKYILNKYGHLLNDEITSIHVRRGDYLKESDNYAVCSYAYFKKAIKYIGVQKKFLIFSNDIPWCKKKFRGENFFFSEQESPIVDLYLQSFCSNHIISNSSFSWWGAWLNESPTKTVIYPAPWFGVAYSDKDTKDLVPAEWTQIENKTLLYYRVVGYLGWWKKRIDYYIKTKIKKSK
jgi:hypothetical protein